MSGPTSVITGGFGPGGIPPRLLHQPHAPARGLNPEALAGIQKLITRYIPGDVVDLCGYNNATLKALNKEIQALQPGSPKLRVLWIKAQDFVIKNALSIYRLRADRDRGGQEREERPGHPLRRGRLELLGGVGPRLSAAI